jgi:hypothetical protein
MLKPDEKKPAHTPDAGKVTGSQAHPSIGYETTDVSASGVAIFLASLSAFLVVFFVFCFAMGKVINNALVKHDGPPNKWNAATAAPHRMGKSLQSTTAMEQQQLQTMTQRFPTPRLQMDDGNQDLADMHQKEDLLLDHYTWVDKSQGKVRIPIDRAMELIVQRGLPVAPANAPETGDNAASAVNEAHTITPPLTNGFARTTYEQDEMTEDAVQSKRQPASEISSKKQNAPGTTLAKQSQVASPAGGVQ